MRRQAGAAYPIGYRLKGIGRAQRRPTEDLGPDRIAEQWRLLIRELAKERERKGLTQAQVAAQMGTSQPYIARLEGAANDPRLSTLLRYSLIVVGGAVLVAILREIGGGGTVKPPMRIG
jgi:DNA-binding XRE family transcriptional regulator